MKVFMYRDQQEILIQIRLELLNTEQNVPQLLRMMMIEQLLE